MLLLPLLIGCTARYDGTYQVTLERTSRECVEDGVTDIDTDTSTTHALMSIYRSEEGTLIVELLSQLMVGEVAGKEVAVSWESGWQDTTCGLNAYTQTGTFTGRFTADLGIEGTYTLSEHDTITGCDTLPDSEQRCTTELDITGARLNARSGQHASDAVSWGYIPTFGNY